MKKLLLILVLSVMPCTLAMASESLVIKDYQKAISFDNTRVVRLQKGDNPRYSDPAFDDSSWKRVSFPSNWNDHYENWRGICWYRLHITLPSELPEKSLGIRLGTIIDVDRVYFNGTPIGQTGSFKEGGQSAYDVKRLYQVPVSLLRPGGDNVLALQVKGLFSYVNGPYTGEFRVGDYAGLHTQLLSREFFDVLLVIIYLTVSVYFMLFFIRRPQDRENLLFSLFAGTCSVYFFLRTQVKYILFDNFHYLKKSEYLMLLLIFVFMLEFITVYYNRQRTYFHYAFYGISAIAFAVILVSGSYTLWDNIIQYAVQPAWILPVFITFMILVKNFKSSLDARLMLGTIIVFGLSFINDVLVNSTIYDAPRLANYGFFFFIGGIALILDNRFVRLHHEVADLNKNLEQKVIDRTEELSAAMEELQSINEYVTEINRKNERDLQLASAVQHGLIAPVIKTPQWDTEVFLKAASSVSGDFYDFYRLDEHTLGVALMDVSGHGVSSALVTMLAKPIFLQSFEKNPDKPLKKIITDINDQMKDSLSSIDNYLTGILMQMHPDNIYLINAAHPAPFIKYAKSGKIVQVEATGMFLGIEGMGDEYKTARIHMQSGDMILLYTDALVESKNPDGEEFGMERVRGILSQRQWDPKSIIDELISQLFEFTGTSTLDDDLTIIVSQRQ